MGNQNETKKKKLHGKDRSNNFDQTEFKPIKNDSSLDKTYKIIAIIIPLDEGYWEKRYNINQSVSQIEIDFRKENSISENTKITFIYKNKNLKIDKDIKIDSLIEDEKTKEIIIYHQINDNETINENFSNFFGKPFYSPFQIVIFNRNKKNFKTKEFDVSIINEKFLNKCNATSSYCNGNNHLYISGGVDNENNKIGIFWKINLENCEIEDVNYGMPAIKNHSMIQIEDKVYIVGGQNEKCYFYNTKNNTISEFANLNYVRVEPSLIKYQNFLYCIDSMKDQYYKFSIERIDLNSNEKKWELLTPKISENLNDEEIFSQKFFGVTIDKKEGSILFLGGSMDNYNPENKDIKNFKYIVNENIIEKSDIPYKEFSVKEKTFKPFNHKVDFILPDFDKLHHKIVFYLKEKKTVEIVNYRHKTKHENDDFNKPSNNLNFFKVDFNMPGIMSKSQNFNEYKDNKSQNQNRYLDSKRKDDLPKISIRASQPDQKINFDSQFSSSRAQKNFVIDTNVKSNDKNNEKDIKVENKNINNQKKIEENQDTILDIKAPENDKKENIFGDDENKEKKNKKEDEQNKSFTSEIIPAPLHLFHSTCDDPGNVVRKNEVYQIKEKSRNIKIPNNFPTMKEIRKINRGFYSKKFL